MESQWEHIKYSPENPKGWKYKAAAKTWYRDHLETFRSQRDGLAERLKQGLPARTKPMTPHERRIQEDKRIPIREIDII